MNSRTLRGLMPVRLRSSSSLLAPASLAAAVERYLQRLSEASRHVPETLKQKHPNIDWPAIADIGNVLHHAYDKIVDRRVWQVVSSDPAPLEAAEISMIDELHRTDTG